MKREKRIEQILEKLDETYPDARCALEHGNPLELLVATILSAQCTDERVNLVTRELFGKFRKPEDYLGVPAEEFEADIHSTGFFRNKTKSIRGACRVILDRFEGKVPDTMEGLLELPGVARKTANVVLGTAFGKAEGIVVDTHVLRVSRRLGLSRDGTAEKVEADLMGLMDRERWIAFSHQVIQHGRRVCKARKPLCGDCSVEDLCSSEDKTTPR